MFPAYSVHRAAKRSELRAILDDDLEEAEL